MENPDKIEIFLDKICNSKSFTSPADSRLLRYLVDATIKGKVLKETIIAVDIFNRDPVFNPGNDSIVRSNIYNLRKKIADYYNNEGHLDEIRISIPKGSYRVEFSERKQSQKENYVQKRIQGKSFLWVLTGSSLILTIIIFVLYIRYRSDMPEVSGQYKSNYFWSDIFHSDKKLLIVPGNYFMMERVQPSDSSTSFIRNPSVNTPNDFLRFRDNNPGMKDQLKAFGMSHFGEEIPWCIIKIADIFRYSKKNIDIKYSSELTPADLRENDIIFIGDFSTLGIMRNILNQTHYRFKLNPPTIYYSANYTDTTEIMTLANLNRTDFQNDYSIIGKISGQQGNKIMFFLSYSPFGKTEAIYRLTDPSFRDELQEINPEQPDSWDMLLKVSGLGTSGFYYEILRFETLEKN